MYLLQLAAAATGGTAAYLYSQAPRVWSQMLDEMAADVLPPDRRPNPGSWPDRGLFATWLGHSTVLFKLDGFTVLTDPVFSLRVGVGLGPVTLGLKRIVEPAIHLASLPRIDLLLLSHAHMDHLDRPSLRRLQNRGTAIITAAETSDLIPGPGRFRSITEMRWGQSARCGPVQCRAFEVKHWGARFRHDHYRGYNGYLLETDRYRVVFAGDTALTSTFRTLRVSRPIDLAVMPIGAYNPWVRNHCTPEQAWRMGNEAGAEMFIPVHHSTFNLSREPRTEPIERFVQVSGTEDERIPVRRIGEEFSRT